MCGIAFALRRVSAASNEPLDGPRNDVHRVWSAVEAAVQSRGPDASKTIIRTVRSGEGVEYDLRFHASVLHMRGEGLTEQPLVATNGDVLLWNGEIFDGLEVAPHENDGRKLMDQIQRAGPADFFSAIRDVEGPYAMVYFQAATGRIYFARDPLGRRSLLVRSPSTASPLFLLASTLSSDEGELECGGWDEVETQTVQCITLADLGRSESNAIDVSCGSSTYLRLPKRLRDQSPHTLIYPYDPIATVLPRPEDLTPSSADHPSEPEVTPALAELIDSFIGHLERAMRARVATVPAMPPPPDARIAVLFSGGLDCTVLALVLDRVLPAGEAIDLLTVAFENPRKIQAQKNGKAGGSSRKGKGVARSGDTPPEVPEVDPPITSTVYDVPDRLTARRSWEELKRLSPERRWNLVEINVAYREMLAHRQTVIDLMAPTRTVMDLSISVAFWFAARGRGHLSQFNSCLAGSEVDRPPPTPHHSRARVLLSGLGADEQLGGYARHRRAFAHTRPHPQPPCESTASGPEPVCPDPSPQSSTTSPQNPIEVPPRESWCALLSELQLDLDRLPTRNLGRDDRVISSHGKEARYPYLAGQVVDFLAHVPVWLKADYRFAEGIGEKMLLRLVAKKLGLAQAASLPKKAIHFGVNTAKMELAAGRSKGTDLLS